MRSTMRAVVPICSLIVVLILAHAALRAVGIDETIGTQDSAAKLRMLLHRLDTGTWWFPAASALDPEGRLHTLTSGYFSGPDTANRFWSDYVNPYTFLLLMLWPIIGAGSVIAVNAVTVAIAALALLRAVGAVQKEDRMFRAVGLGTALLLIATVLHHAMFLWEHAFAVALAVIGVTIWWAAQGAHGWRRALALAGGGIALGVAVATRYEVGWFLAALAVVVAVRGRARASRRDLAVVAVLALAVFGAIVAVLWVASSGWSLHHLTGHLREPRLFVVWHNLFDVLAPNRVAALLGAGAVRILPIAAAVVSTVALTIAIAWRRRLTAMARIIPLAFALLSAAATASFWPYGLFGAMPWVVLLPFLAADDHAYAPTDRGQEFRRVLLWSAAFAWVIGLIAIPIHGGGQLGPRFFLLPSFMLAAVAIGTLRTTGGLRGWRQRFGVVPAALALLLFLASGYHVAYYFANNAYKARYVSVWSAAVAPTRGPVVFVRDERNAAHLLPRALRGRQVLRVRSEADDAYLIAQVSREQPSALVLVTDSGQGEFFLTSLRTRGYVVEREVALPLSLTLRTLVREEA